jgi:putative endonuclease
VEESQLRQHNDYLYIATNRSGTLYIGMTNDLVRRMNEHRAGEIEGFTKKYNITRLVYFEHTTDVTAAIAREKQIKGWRRNKKIKLIEKMNPNWWDLFDEINAE